MDLSRWSLKNLGNKLGDVLDSDLPVGDADVNRDAFEISDLESGAGADSGSGVGLDAALALLRPGASSERVLSAFMPFFEGGACLRVEGAQTFLTSLFLFGQTFTPAESHGTPIDFGLRSLEMSRVYKMPLEPLLRALNVAPLFRLDGAFAFAFAVSADCVFVLFDNRPHPWQVFAIESAYLSARDTFTRLGRSRSK